MDHRDYIEGPSLERRKLLEKRMEMIANLMNQLNEGENQKQEQPSDKKRKRIDDCSGIMPINWLCQLVTVLHRMFT